MVHGTAVVRLHASCQWITAPYRCVWSMEQLRCAFTRVVNGLLHLAWVFGLRHSCGARLREVLRLTAPYTCVWSIAHLRTWCMTYSSAAVRLYVRCVYGFCPLHGCLGFSTATARLQKSGQWLTAPGIVVRSMAQLQRAFARNARSFLLSPV